ncbi:MAG: restriction endonuclease [Myxococcales bacterium]|nr:restriction endonuclease [Myxococcales bacterium]
MSKKAKPSTTTQRIHFTDLDPGRFEDLCLALVFPLHPWTDIQHYGRAGTDGGVDIHAWERTENGARREWRVQCRRYENASKATLRQAVLDALGKGTRPPEVLLVVVACDPSRAAYDDYVSFAGSKGVLTPLLWTASLLEARLYNERRDLLFAYFGISTASEARDRERAIVRNIGLRKRLRRELNALRRKEAKPFQAGPFSHLRAIVHSIDDSSYPNADATEEVGISGWFRLELWDFYFNGLEFVMDVERGFIDNEGNWGVAEEGAEWDQSRFREIKMYRLARIPFENIVEVDVDGDEYYPEPHLFCRFANGGQPYEGFRNLLLDGDETWPLEEDRRLVAPNEKSVRLRTSKPTVKVKPPGRRARR